MTRTRLVTEARRESLHAALLAAVAVAVITVGFSNGFLPRLESACGRLKRVPSGFDSLSMNLVRLETRPGTSWQSVTARYRLEEGEALSFVLDRRVMGGESPDQVGGDYRVVRISRIPSLPSAILTFVDDVVSMREPLPHATSDIELAGELSLERRADGVTLSLSGNSPMKLPGNVPPGEFEISLFPPASVHLHDRVKLGHVVLTDERALRPDWTREVASRPDVQAAIVVALAAAGWGRLRRLPGRWFPFHAERSPGSIAVWLVCTLAVVLLLSLIPRHQLLQNFSVKGRVLFRLVLSLMVGACVVFMALRERFFVRFGRFAGGRWAHPAMLPVQLAAMAVSLAVVVVALGSLQVRFEPVAELGRSASSSRIRIAVVGGSQTRGYPFPEGWTGTFAAHVERLLRARGMDSVVVWNLGVDAAGLDYIREHLPAHVASLAVTHLVVNSVVNSAPLGMADVYRSALEGFLVAARPLVSTIDLVEEPDLEPVYQAGRWPSVSPLYPVLEDVAQRHGLTVINPVPTLIEHREDFLFMDDVHFTPHGHRIMGEVVAAGLERQLAGLEVPVAPVTR